MRVQINAMVMLPGYAPYPRYGRVAKFVDDANVLVTQVLCGDPRCAAEHAHNDVVWNVAELESSQAYQPRAGWELGRLSSPNAVIEK
ncbi:MAG TPA: hypothetical protein VMT89_18980 [Candidatus Acidoferrales bacterium]|nr:hypothetical protein [Candidatus Acidoferrales bacterium]